MGRAKKYGVVCIWSWCLRKIPTIVVSENLFLREGLLRILSATPRYRVISVNNSAEECPPTPNDCPTLYVFVTDHSPLDTTRIAALLETDVPLARIVVLDANSDASACREALRAGASAYLHTSMEPDAFIKALDLIMVGGLTLIANEPSQMVVLFAPGGDHKAADLSTNQRAEGTIQWKELTLSSSLIPAHDDMVQRLSLREGEILKCIVRGESNKRIARQFEIAEATVKAHVKTILRKIGARNRTQAAMWAVRHRLSGLLEKKLQEPASSE